MFDAAGVVGTGAPCSKCAGMGEYDNPTPVVCEKCGGSGVIGSDMFLMAKDQTDFLDHVESEMKDSAVILDHVSLDMFSKRGSLPGRPNIVVTANMRDDEDEGPLVYYRAATFDDAVRCAEHVVPLSGRVFVVTPTLYDEALEYADEIYLAVADFNWSGRGAKKLYFPKPGFFVDSSYVLSSWIDGKHPSRWVYERDANVDVRSSKMTLIKWTRG